MTEDDAWAVTLLQAFETARPPSPSWGIDDAAWATRVALDDGPAPSEGADAFIARRARHALERLKSREPAAARWSVHRHWRWQWAAWAALVGCGVGGLIDSIGSNQRINLLAPPLAAVLAWNLAVCLILLGGGLARAVSAPRRSPSRAGSLLRRALRRDDDTFAVRGAAAASGSGAAWRGAGRLWLRRSAPLITARAALLLHAAAASLAVGLVAGLYLRGLVLDYRAAWESTFLDARTAHAVLATVLSPAAALSGIAVPDVAAFEALRTAHGAAPAGAPAASWIHLIALTLALFVVLPRALLVVFEGVRMRWLARHVVLPIDDPYFQRLVRQRRGGAAHVVVVPYAATPVAQAGLALRAVFAEALGPAVVMTIAPRVAFGAEEVALPEVGTPRDWVVALFDLSATPEPETHGAFVRLLGSDAPTILMVDETAFRARFAGAAEARIEPRRAAWLEFARTLGTAPVHLQLGAVDAATSAAAIEQAMRQPVGAVAVG